MSNLNAQSELDFGGRETCLYFKIISFSAVTFLGPSLLQNLNEEIHITIIILINSSRELLQLTFLHLLQDSLPPDISFYS